MCRRVNGHGSPESSIRRLLRVEQGVDAELGEVSLTRPLIYFACVRRKSYEVYLYEAARVDLDDIIRSTTVLVAMHYARTYICTYIPEYVPVRYQYLVRVHRYVLVPVYNSSMCDLR